LQILETNRSFIIFTGFVCFLAGFIHFLGHTMFFTTGFFEEPNLYTVWPRFDQITHSLSSCAVTSFILNFNLPLSFKKKWSVALLFGIFLSFLWEAWEYISFYFLSNVFHWINISNIDTLLDFHQNFYGAVLAILVYTILVKPRIILIDKHGSVISLGYE